MSNIKNYNKEHFRKLTPKRIGVIIDYSSIKFFCNFKNYDNKFINASTIIIISSLFIFLFYVKSKEFSFQSDIDVSIFILIGLILFFFH